MSEQNHVPIKTPPKMGAGALIRCGLWIGFGFWIGTALLGVVVAVLFFGIMSGGM